MDVRSEILDYITRKEKTGALLITGKWGCGKSYLVKEISKELNATKKAAVAVISLFGLDSVTAINKRVKDEYTGFILGSLGKKVRKVSKGIATVAKDGLNVASIATVGTPGLSAASQGLSSILSYDLFSLIDVKNTVGKDEKEREFIIAFDDLERSTLDKKVLLGTINEFVENKGIKVIIIADEEKITGEDYKEYKEKLISRTIRLADNYNAIIECIVNDYAETVTGYKQFLMANLDLIKQVYFESNSNNLRTLKTGLADFERMYEAWIETGIDTEQMKWALYTFMAEVFSSKDASKKDEEEHTGNFFFETKKQYEYKDKNGSSFSSFWRWLNEGTWDKEFFIRELIKKYVGEDETPLHHFIWCPFYYLEQIDIDKGLPAALELAYKGELDCNDLVSLLMKAHYLKECSIDIPCEIDYDRITKGFMLRCERIKAGEIDEPRCHSYADNNQIDPKAYEVNSIIKGMESKKAVWEYRRKFLDYFNHGSYDSGYSLKGLCVEEFDDEMLEVFKSKYAVASNEKRREYSRTLLSLGFNSDNYTQKENRKKSRETFEKLIMWLQKLESKGQFSDYLNSIFVSDIQAQAIMREE